MAENKNIIKRTLDKFEAFIDGQGIKKITSKGIKTGKEKKRQTYG